MKKNTELKPIRKLSKDETEHNLKILKRFFKEYGCFNFMMKYMFSHGRPASEFYDSLQRDTNIMHSEIRFDEALSVVGVLGPYFKETGFYYWHEHIEKIHNGFVNFCKDNKNIF